MNLHDNGDQSIKCASDLSFKGGFCFEQNNGGRLQPKGENQLTPTTVEVKFIQQ